MEAGTRSTFRELLAAKHVLTSLTKHLAHESVLRYSDNWNVSRILEVRSAKDHLQEIALEIFALRVKQDVMIIPCWVPREDIEFADALSKFRDTDNLSIDDESFHFIQQRFGKLRIDRFADENNTKLTCFDARFHCPGAETINTFTGKWAKDFNWWCPPIALIAATLKHAEKCRPRGHPVVEYSTPMWCKSWCWTHIFHAKACQTQFSTVSLSSEH